MALKAIANKEEFGSFPEDVQAHYSEDASNPEVFRLSVTPANGVELADVAGLKSALQKERDQAATLKTSLSSFDGLDAAEARTALEELEALKKDGGGSKTRDEVRAELDATYITKFNADKDTLTRKFTTDVESRDQKIGMLAKQLERKIIDGDAMTAITKAGGSLELILPLVRNVTKAVELESGARVPRIFDTNGQERMSPKAGSSDPMTIEEYVTELRSDQVYARAFDASGQSGSGATGGGAIVETSNAFVLSKADQLNPAKYQDLKARATKAGKQVAYEA